MIAFFRELARRSPARVTLDIFGGGNGLQALRDAVSRTGLSGRVRFHGAVSQEELFGRLHEYDAGLCYIPYADYDTAPALKFLEYAAAGLAVFSSDTKGMVKNRDIGLTAEYFANDVESFCQAVLPWTTRPYPASRLRINRTEAETQDWPRLVRRDYFPLYERLASEQRASLGGDGRRERTIVP
jgi:glycosyltransferase involved in cell wall biosynthesis